MRDLIQRAPVPVVWTVTPEVKPTGSALAPIPEELADRKFWEVNGDEGDPHDARHFTTLLGVLNFLVEHKLKRGDTVVIPGPGTGRALRVDYVREGDRIVFDVGAQVLPTPEELVGWLHDNLQPGDTVALFITNRAAPQRG